MLLVGGVAWSAVSQWGEWSECRSWWMGLRGDYLAEWAQLSAARLRKGTSDASGDDEGNHDSAVDPPTACRGGRSGGVPVSGPTSAAVLSPRRSAARRRIAGLGRRPSADGSGRFRSHGRTARSRAAPAASRH